MKYKFKKIKYRNYKGTLKELMITSLGMYFLIMTLDGGGELRINICDPENIEWLDEEEKV